MLRITIHEFCTVLQRMSLNSHVGRSGFSSDTVQQLGLNYTELLRAILVLKDGQCKHQMFIVDHQTVTLSNIPPSPHDGCNKVACTHPSTLQQVVWSWCHANLWL